MSFGQFAATSQFYLYGRQYCTADGYVRNMKKYLKGKEDILQSPALSLDGKVSKARAGKSPI